MPGSEQVRRSGGRVAVVGSGVSGLSAAHLLSSSARVTLFEQDGRLGGHAHTHTVTGSDGAAIAVDSGFIVHNDRTYPVLTRLLDNLGVTTRACEMSMSISDSRTGLVYAGGKGLPGILARPMQLGRRDFRRVLGSVRPFHAAARGYLATAPESDLTSFGDFLAEGGFCAEFIDLYAIPLVSCVWSTGRADALAYPARYLFTFLDHHGMLTLGDSPQWKTIVGGSAAYVAAIADQLPDVRRGARVTRIARSESGVSIGHTSGAGGGQSREEFFDAVVIATHADEALALLADPTPLEKELLGAFRYSTNSAVLHQDSSLLPAPRRARASWNFRVAEIGSTAPAAVTYWMNTLQGIDRRDPLLVTLNDTGLVDPALVLATMTYTHPVYEAASVAAQSRLGQLTSPLTAYAGAYHGWGFHEDGARAGVAAAQAFGASW